LGKMGYYGYHLTDKSVQADIILYVNAKNQEVAAQLALDTKAS
jgi:hypothetical protein